MSHNFYFMLDIVIEEPLYRWAIDNKVNKTATQKLAYFFYKSVNMREVESILLVTFSSPDSRVHQWWPVATIRVVWPCGPQGFSHCPNPILSFQQTCHTCSIEGISMFVLLSQQQTALVHSSVQNCGYGGGILSSPDLASILDQPVGLGLRTGALSMFSLLFMEANLCLISVGVLSGKEFPTPPSMTAELIFVSVQDSGSESFLSFYQGRWLCCLPFPRTSGSLLGPWKWGCFLLSSQWVKAFA